MNPVSTDRSGTGQELRGLYGRIVLVTSARDHRNPPAGLRGWLEVPETVAAEPKVNLVLEFPQMFASRAHHRTIPLSRDELARLLASECNGALAFTIDDELK